MPVGKDKSSIATVVPIGLKQRLERVATSKKWTLSQTVKECLESFIDQWEKDLGVVEEPAPTPKKRSSKSVS
jgi:predicted DNA-binding protein